MVKKRLLIFVFLITFSEVSGSVIDSLKLELAKNKTDSKEKIDILNELAYQHWTFDPDQSKSYSQEALLISETLDYREGLAFANRSLGVANWTQGDYEEGLNYLLTALIEYQTLSDTLNIANVMMNTALIYVEQDSYDEAFRYFSEALKTFDMLLKPKRYINTANHIGELFQRQELYEKALGYYLKSLQISDSIEYNYGKATAYLNIGSLYKATNRLDSALFYSQRAKRIQSSSADINGLATSYYTLGTIHLMKEDFEMAQMNLLKGLELAEKLNSKKLKRDIYQELSKLSKQKREFKKATEYLEEYALLNDSLLNAELLKNIVRFENKIELEKKEAELERQQYQVQLLEKESKINDLILYALMLGIAALLILTYLIWSRQKIRIRKNAELLKASQELNESQQELAQIAVENAQLKERELRKELEFKSKELTSYTLNFIQKNDLLTEVKSGLVELKKSKEGEKGKQLTSLMKLVDSSVNIDRDWNDFKLHFEEVHSNFFTILSERFPDITNNELKLCALLKLNMNLKEAANIMGISPESVKTARYRLRKKLGLDKEDNLVEFVINIEDQANS